MEEITDLLNREQLTFLGHAQAPKPAGQNDRECLRGPSERPLKAHVLMKTHGFLHLPTPHVIEFVVGLLACDDTQRGYGFQHRQHQTSFHILDYRANWIVYERESHRAESHKKG